MNLSHVKEWYIQIEGKQEGPYSVSDLKKDLRITPETFVRKKGFAEWIPIGKVKELKEVFKDEGGNEESVEELDSKELIPCITPDGIILEVRRDPPHFLLWVAFFILLLLYLFYKFL